MWPSTYQTVLSTKRITLYACTSDLSNITQYIDKPESGTFTTYSVGSDDTDMVFYYLTDGNGKKYIVGSEPHSIRH